MSYLALHFYYEFISNGLLELWMVYMEPAFHLGFIPLYFLAHQLSPLVCSVIIKAHVLAARDITNKFGTKAAELR